MIQPPTYEKDASEAGTAKPQWTEEAEERLKRVPFFVRGMVRGAVERYALEHGQRDITPAMMEDVKQKAMGGRFGGH